MTRRPRVRVVDGDPAVAGGADAVPVARVPPEPFSLTGTTVAAVVGDPVTAAATLQAVARGADAIVRIDEPDRPDFLDALARIADISTDARPTVDVEQRALLTLLADGHTAGEAARLTGMSLRTAHRRLHAARLVLGATSNAEAAARLGAPPRPD